MTKTKNLGTKKEPCKFKNCFKKIKNHTFSKTSIAIIFLTIAISVILTVPNSVQVIKLNQNHNIKNPATSITKGEDDKYLYYNLCYKGYEKNNISIAVDTDSRDEGSFYLYFSGYSSYEKKERSENYESESKAESSFNYYFPLPDNIDKKAIIEHKNNKVIVKFKKYSNND